MIDINTIPIIRERRKTYTIHITPEGQVEIKAPFYVSERILRAFADKHIQWIEEQITKKAEVREKANKAVEDILGIAEITRKPSYKTIVGHVRKADGSIYITAPEMATDNDIRVYVVRSRNWFEKHSEILRNKYISGKDVYSADELDNVFSRAKDIIPKRVEYWAPIVGVKYSSIVIMSAVRNWGSCDRKGRLMFNCLLVLCPSDVMDSVIIHELCHRLHLNHSSRFYSEVLRVMPNYWEKRRWLITEGQKIISKLKESRLPLRKI